MIQRRHHEERNATRLVLIASCLVLIGAAATVLALVATGHTTNDWTAFYGAGTLVRTGEASHLYSASAQAAVQRSVAGGNIDPTGYPLPVFAALVFMPFSLLSLGGGYVAWFAVNMLLAGALVRLSWRWLDSLPPTMRATFVICALALAIRTLLLGQVDLFVLGAVVGCYAMLRSGHELGAGSILAIGLFKPHLIAAVVLLLLVKRAWRTIGAFAVAGGALLFLPPIIGGPQLVVDQVRALVSPNGATAGYGGDAKLMINIRATVESLTGSSSVWLWLPLLLVIAGVSLTVAVRIWRQRQVLHPQSWALAFALPLLYSPHVHFQSIVLLIAAAALYLIDSQATGRPVSNIKYVLLPLIAITMLWALSLWGVSLMALLIVGAFSLFARRWPERATLPIELPAPAELALAS